MEFPDFEKTLGMGSIKTASNVGRERSRKPWINGPGNCIQFIGIELSDT